MSAQPGAVSVAANVEHLLQYLSNCTQRIELSLPHLVQVPGRIVGTQQGLRGLDRVPTPRLLQQLLAAHPPFRLHEVELVEPAHERV